MKSSRIAIKFKNYNKKVKNYRTVIIEESSSLEVQLEWIISSYFSRSYKEYGLFNDIFFSDEVKLGFYDKIRMFEKLIDDALPEFKKQYPDTIKKLNRIRKIRNSFAHGDASNPWYKHEKRLTKEIIFIVVEKGEHKEISYTFDYIKDIVKDCMYLNRVLGNLIRDLKYEMMFSDTFSEISRKFNLTNTK